MSAELRVGHTGAPGAWRGLIKHGKEVVWICNHTHPNRDEDAGHTAARPCASLVLKALTDPDGFTRTTEAMQRSGCGVAGPLAAESARRFAWTIERRGWAMDQAHDLRSRIAIVSRPSPPDTSPSSNPIRCRR